MKVRLFVATVETVLLYGAETWTLTNALKKKLDSCYTRMLRMALNISWKSHTTNQQLYGDLPPVSLKAKQRRMRVAGHGMRHSEKEASNLVLWIPTDGHANRGRRRVTYRDSLLQDTGLESVQDLQIVMQDREHWGSRVDSVVKHPER